MSNFIDARVIQKTGSESEWLANDLILYKGELALVTQGDRVINIKVGNGTKKFSELPYIYNGGFTDSVTPTTQGSTLVDGMYIANGSGTYTNMGGLVVKDGYFTIISKVGTTYKIVSEVKMPEVDIDGAISEGQTDKAVNGDTIYNSLRSIDVSTKVERKNKFNKLEVTPNTLVNELGVTVPYDGWSTSAKIPILPNTDYAYSPSIISIYSANDTLLLRQDWFSSTFRSPSNSSYAIISVSTENLDIMQLELGNAISSYEPYIADVFLNVNKIIDYSIHQSKLDKTILRGERNSKNLANYRTFKNGYYVSETNGKEINNIDFSVSPYIAVKSDTYYFQTEGNRVAFYTSEDENTFISGIFNLAFKTPANANFIKVCTSIATKEMYQLEEGTTATSYEDYFTYKLPSTQVSGLEEISSEIITEIPFISKHIKDFAPNFYKKWMLRNSDVVVVLNGESISTTNYYAESFTDAKNRPPLMTEKSYTAFIEETFRWEGQKYYRFDNIGIFTETGNATTKEYDKAWDWTRANESELASVNNRPAITRILEGVNCSVSYIIPNDAYRCDFIYRTDYLNAPNAVVAISSGNGKVQVYDETTNDWVEANGYSYSAQEDGTLLPGSLYKSMYQKRLKMRKVNISNSDIRVTITNNGSGRLTYWGYQTSPLENMFDFILSARGGHSIQRLENFEAWDTDYFKPDLILWQVPIINEGLDVANSDYTPKTMTKTKEQYALGITNKYAQYKSKSYAPEIISYMLWFGKGNNGIDENNDWVFGNDPNGKKVAIPTYIYHSIASMEILNQNVIDLFSLIYKYAIEDARNKESNIINTNLIGSGMSGKTFTTDGVHYNTNGNNIIFKMFGNFFK